MAFSNTVDARPHVMGDMLMLTGTWDGTGVDAGAIDVSAQLSSIVAAGASGGAPGSAGTVTTNTVLPSAAPGTLNIDFVSGSAGSWWALGRRS